MSNPLHEARAALIGHLQSLPTPKDPHASGRIDGLLEAIDFLVYQAALDDERIPSWVTFNQWRDRDSGWREAAGKR